MKKFRIIIFMVLAWVGVSHAQTAEQLYKAVYSSKFAVGDASYSDKVLTIWKDFDSNTLDKHMDWFSDTVTMILADGKIVKGKAENLAAVKAYRSSLKDIKTSVEAWVCMKSLDRNENVVCVWSDEQVTDKDGKTTANRLHEVWAFNKDGKIYLMLQYSGGNPTM